MSQALQSPYAVPVLQIAAAVAILQIVGGGNVSKFVANRLIEIKDECLESARKMIYDSPVIAISAGLTYLVQEFVAPKIPFLSLSMPECTPLKATLVVAGILAVRSALSAYLERVITGDFEKESLEKESSGDLQNALFGNVLADFGNTDKQTSKSKKSKNSLDHVKKQEKMSVEYLRHTVIRNVVPIAAACAAAYYAEIPVKLTQTAIFTTALIPMVKLLGKGLENFVNLEHVKDTAGKVFAWIQ